MQYTYITCKYKYVIIILYARIIRLLESGLMDHWIRQYIATKGYCRNTNDKKSGTSHPVSLDDIQGAFVLWVIGLGLAFIAFIIEHLLFQCPYLKWICILIYSFRKSPNNFRKMVFGSWFGVIPVVSRT